MGKTQGRRRKIGLVGQGRGAREARLKILQLITYSWSVVSVVMHTARPGIMSICSIKI